MAAKILVIGGSGTVGRHLVAELAAKGEQVRLATRRPTASARSNVESVKLDLSSGQGLPEAFEGVDRVFALSPAGYLDQPGLISPVVEEATRRGAKVVLQTAMGVDADDNIPFRQLELKLERAGVPYVILRPNWFTDNFDTYWGAQIASGALRLPAGEGATSFIDARDIAASAAGALTSADHDNQAFDLTGPEALTYAQAAEIISRETGLPVRYENVNAETFVRGRVQAGVPEDYARFLATILGVVAQGWTAKVVDGVERLSGRKPRTLADHFREKRQLAA
ncbi:MAG TPA: SDR family oxidoreductase [Mesorhizobium sp.]|jgi:uncharacterized protein YbjT (DUF2867 family)|nr:SDR family oxidoreductase [Mesorhizobium sp.]